MLRMYEDKEILNNESKYKIKDNKLYKNEGNALFGLLFEDKSCFIIGSYNWGKNARTFDIYLYDSEKRFSEEHEIKGRNHDCAEYIEEIAGKNYGSINDFIREELKED